MRNNTNVFLVDTGCSSHPTYRAWCAVESWARQNPDLDVLFILTSLTMDDSTGLASLLLHRYTNLRVVGVDLNLLFQGTPLLEFFMSRKWTVNNTWPKNVLSNMVRVVVLWRWGGIYSDNDVISVRTYTLPLNAVGVAIPGLLGNGFLSFSSHHPILWSLMGNMKRGFIPDQWGSTGIHPLTRVMMEACGTDDAMSLMKQLPFSCANVTIYSQSYFSPFHFMDPLLNFKSDGKKEFDKAMNVSYSIHLYNKITKWSVVTVGRNSIYEITAKNFCPLTYSRASMHSNFF
ncbi:hypothetical protein Pcinc_016602 [Petrolisthes cinctipes]|uniref:Alpha 1,4-glycosyltransferase domain-containing protein n=2 Tax=Petrolisthes cinctipes TaxID=88211 RepID=A0AAE1FSG7_PETCI|nr:hypothetical protein Pcinc_016602 [Petrolisthes cinctipes]